MNFANSGEDGFLISPEDMVDGTLVIVLGETRFNHNQWDFFTFIEGGDEVWLGISMPDFGEPPREALFDYIPDAIAAGGTCESNSCEGVDPTIVVDPNEVAEEGETTAGLPVSLLYAPDGDVTITVYSAEPNYPDQPNENFKFIGANRVDDYTGQITLNAGTMSGTFEVQAFNDDIIEGDVTYPLTLIATSTVYEPNFINTNPEDPNGIAIVSPGSVTVIDNDVRSILVDPDFVALSEGDPNVWAYVDVTLSHPPLAVVNVGVNLFEWAADLGMVETDADLEDPNYLQFDAGNWDTPKQIGFRAFYVEGRANEEEPMSQVPAFCDLIPSSADAGYDPETGIEPGAQIAIEVEDIDCGSYGFDERDYNEDCFVNLADFAIFAQGWWFCTDPGNIDCGSALE
jgi:hypothetical protein